ncbi:MAG: MBL fold metallo-hydrolase [Candidatus Krumholzibacteriia bacterium]
MSRLRSSTREWKLLAIAALLPGLLLPWCAATHAGEKRPDASEPPYLVVLGIAQDGGAPQAGTKQHPGWHDPARRRRVVCLGIVDPVSSERWLFEATPDFPEQLQVLDAIAPAPQKPGLAGIFLTHAHMGHYTGLVHLGHEAMGARGVPVHAMPRLREFLSTNGPWDQLVRFGNIQLRTLRNELPVRLNERLTVTPFRVPHRQEYSETVGLRIDGPSRSVLFLPDIDSWEELDATGTPIEERLADVDVAYLDGTFYANGEIPGRDMSGFPHPFMTHSMERFAPLAPDARQKIRFIHLNHTNPALMGDNQARRALEARGFRVAEEMERVDL